VCAALAIDGSHGEGGGQIVRSALALAALLGREVVIENVRAGRPRPGLAPQHLTAVRAAAAICGADLEGDALGSRRLRFAPRAPMRAGDYVFDVAAAREGGSAGAATLVLQTVLLPLARASGVSTLAVRGGTHVPWSPSFEYANAVWLPALRRLGVDAGIELVASGWYPAGGGEIRARVEGRGDRPLEPLEVVDPGPLERVSGRALAANLPSHIPQRMTDRAGALLAGAGIPARIQPLRVRAACPGAGLFLAAEYRGIAAGFDALGERGKSSESVAEEAVAALLAHRASGAALDAHLADQLVAPLALAAGPSRVSVERVTPHLQTSAWVVGEFGLAGAEIARREGRPPELLVTPRA
jgi:RNA 3'-terminal phosphate cyclase (ATP)